MTTRTDIDNKYLNLARILEEEFFDIVPDGVGQKRVLREGKSIDEFNVRHGEIWKNHETELIAEGLIQLSPAPEPKRDLAAEIDEIKAKIADYDTLKAKVEKLEKK